MSQAHNPYPYPNKKRFTTEEQVNKLIERINDRLALIDENDRMLLERIEALERHET